MDEMTPERLMWWMKGSIKTNSLTPEQIEYIRAAITAWEADKDRIKALEKAIEAHTITGENE